MESVPAGFRLRTNGWLAFIGLLTLLFVQPLARLFVHAIQSDLHSHIPLVPFVAGYLWYVRIRPRVGEYRTSLGGTLIASALGCVALAAAIVFNDRLSLNDGLALQALSFVSFVSAGGFLFLGARWMSSAAFPVAFLIFMVPLPDAAVQWLETASALASADTAAALFRLTGMPLLRDGPVLVLPGVALEVARECSGIRSSWVLFITGILASHLYLQSKWRRLVLVCVVIPLGILRNAFRILIIGQLSVHVGPHMLDSMIHRRGGPIFFALSLVPLFVMLWWLRRQEHRQPVPAR